MISEGLGLMAVGMSVVFAFLTLLVIAMQASAKFFEIFKDHFPEDLEQVGPKTTTVNSQSTDERAEIAAAIAAAKAYSRS